MAYNGRRICDRPEEASALAESGCRISDSSALSRSGASDRRTGGNRRPFGARASEASDCAERSRVCNRFNVVYTLLGDVTIYSSFLNQKFNWGNFNRRSPSVSHLIVLGT